MTEPNLRRIVEIADMGLVMSDGTRLSARVWMPEDAAQNPCPVILEYLPYRKRDGTCGRDMLTHPWFAARGYVCVRLDIRGNGDSQGLMTDEYTAVELSDAVEAIHWLAAQPWSTGAVGMMGISWGGFNALQVAALAPEPLRAIITLCSTHDRYADDIHYKGGCLLNENLGWGATMLSFSSRPPDPLLVGEKWRDMWLERLEAEPHLPEIWLSHQTRDDYWRHGSVCEDYSAIKAATLAIGGWGDAYKNAVAELVHNISAPAKGIIGPWVHKYPHFAVPEPRIGFLQEALRWWDKWLKGHETGVESDPDLRLYVMESVRPKRWYTSRPGRWIAQNGAGEDITPKTLHLTDQGLRPEVGKLSTKHISSPLDTGAEAGEYCAIWLGPELPGDQRLDDARSVCFDSPPLDQPLEIVGAPEVCFHLWANARQGQVAVRLCEVHPDGSATRITYGVLNLTHRQGHETPQDLPKTKRFEIRLTLDQIAWQLAPGNRLRLSVSSAYWPLIWPSPYKTDLWLEQGSLTLPTHVVSSEAGWQFDPPETADAPQPHILRPENHVRRVELDHVSGERTLVIVDDFGASRDPDHGLETGEIAREWWSIHPDDPASAKGRTHWTQQLRRGDWQIRTETTSQMTCDASTFYLKARIEAYEGDTLVFERDFSKSIARNGV
jgi:uncharacterized protein